MIRLSHAALAALLVAVSGLGASPAEATTIAQNSAWNVTRPGATENLRIVAYGDSIYAGYINFSTIARRAGPHVAGEYMAALYGQNIEIRRRAQSGATASGIYSRITSSTDRAFMQTANTRVVTFAMCGNDYLQARSAFASQTGQCNYTGLNNALATCLDFTERSMQYIDANAHPNVRLKIAGNLYYPGFDTDNVETGCTDPESGQTFNRRDRFLPLLAESNWATCTIAEQYGWECADFFAEYMAADFDSDGKGMSDRDAIRYRSGESKEDYLHRITVEHVHLLSDSNFKEIAPDLTADYLLSDNTHATYIGATAATSVFLIPTTPGGNVPVFHATAGAYPNGKNPTWNTNGSDRLGWELTRAYDLGVDAGNDVTLLVGETLARSATFNDRIFFGPWSVWVDYGNGMGADGQVTAMAFPFSAQYGQAGAFTLDVLVEGAYRTLWSDSATVTVLSTAEAVSALLAQVNALHQANQLSRGERNELRRSLEQALDFIGHNQNLPAQTMVGDFMAKLAYTRLDGATKEAFTSFGVRTQQALAFDAPPKTSGPPAFVKARPDRNKEKPLMPDLPEQLWVEIDGVNYDLDDPRLEEILEGRLGD
jgi:lysophospholipase L1-like esterase